MEPRKPVSDMTNAELNDLIGGLTAGEMRIMLTDVAGYSPDAFDHALARVWVDGRHDEGGTP